MAKIAVFIERYTIRNSVELAALSNYREVAFERGHRLDFLFRNELKYLHNYDAVFIRALTDPLNTSYVVSRLAQMMGIKVIDDPESIRICCDKVNMYRHLMKNGIPMPQTVFVDADEICREKAGELFTSLGSPLVLKAPNTSFSHYVEKVSSVEGFLQVGKRFLRRADRIVVQQYVTSTFDWRVLILDGKILSVVKYIFAPNTWRLKDRSEDGGKLKVQGIPREKADPALLQIALAAAGAIGKGLYGVDIKETTEGYLVIEVNDNPNIDAGDEDQGNPGIYQEIIQYLAGEKGEPDDLSQGSKG